MSVVGVDFGTGKCVVSFVSKGGIDTVISNSGRKTASQVGFGNEKRCLGETAKQNWKRNFRKTIRFPKRLLGKDYDECELEWDHVGSTKYTKGDDGRTYTSLFFKGDEYNFSMEQIVAMLLTHVKEITEEYTKVVAADVVVTVPGYWDDHRRRALLDAAQIAGVNIIRLVNDLTATAMFYLYQIRKQLGPEEIRTVLLVDSGIANTSAGVFELRKNGLRALGCAYDENLGGRDIDLALANFFNEKFKKKNGCDIRDYPKSWLRLLTGCEGVKKTLNLGGATASISEEQIYDDFDIFETITKEEYAELLAPLTSRLQHVVNTALERSNTSPDDLNETEWVGGCMRVNSFQEAVSEVVGKSVENHMNAEEAPSQGAALQSAYESPRIQLQNQFGVSEVQDVGINVTWGPPDGSNDQTLALVKSNGKASFKPKQLALKLPAGPLRVSLSYAEEVPHPLIGSYLIPEIPLFDPETETQSVTFKFKYDHNFITILKSAAVSRKVTVEYQEEVKDEDKEKKDEDVEMNDAENTADAEPENNEDEEATNGDVEMDDTENNKEPEKVEKIEKKYVTKTKTETKKKYLDFILEEGTSITTEMITEWKEVEKKLREIDENQIKTEFTKNALESYVYSTRNALSGKLLEFTTEEERKNLLAELASNESWLYDEGMRQPLEVYEERLGALTAVGDLFFKRYDEWQGKEDAMNYFYNVLENYRNLGSNQTEEYAHIENFGDILTECDRVSALMEEKFEKVRNMSKTDDPEVLTEDLRERTTNFGTFCQNILNTPKPKVEPVPEEKENKKAEPSPEENQNNEVPVVDVNDGDDVMDVD